MTRTRGGFTLLEVMAATSLSVLLLLGVYRAMDLSAQQRQAGRSQAACDQLATSLLRTLEHELQAATPPAKTLAVDSAWQPFDMAKAKQASQSELTSRTTGLSIVAADPSGPNALGIVGNATSVVIPMRESTGMSSDPNAIPAARGFAWQEAGTLSLPISWQQRLAATAFSDRQSLQRAAARRDAVGATAFTLGSHVDRNTGGRPQWSITERRPLGAEIQSLAFRYFDGSTWLADWDGRSGVLRAVEIRLAIRSDAVERSYQLVVPLNGTGTSP